MPYSKRIEGQIQEMQAESESKKMEVRFPRCGLPVVGDSSVAE